MYADDALRALCDSLEEFQKLRSFVMDELYLLGCNKYEPEYTPRHYIALIRKNRKQTYKTNTKGFKKCYKNYARQRR